MFEIYTNFIQAMAKWKVYLDAHERHEICTIVGRFPAKGQLPYEAGVK